ncbi:MalM family protein [Marinobacter sp. F4216]|uniref:MalM family protein n=1 Tax=Marinobacter sp. F4216 TaxID=2874281 RepID=UPI001CC0697C|nr:MalM family protein [Marinobacter sp. F4216]
MPVSDRDGYFTWVDEMGRVQYSRIVNDPEDENDASEDPVHAKLAEVPAESLDEDSEFTLENYPDGNQLERDGYIRPGEPLPYFTWRDAEGNVRVSYFRPDTRSELEKGTVAAPVELSPASIYQTGSSVMPLPDQVEGADPNAFAILGIESGADDYLARFGESCCLALRRGEHSEWQQGRAFGVDISEDSPAHDFLSGSSPYHLVALSSVIDQPDFIMRLRSYASDGVFVPSLLFLDRDFQPLRLVTDMVSAYTPESWSRLGFLESFIPVFPGEGERWVVIFTRQEDLAGQTVVEGRRGPRAIPHIAAGELGLMRVED